MANNRPYVILSAASSLDGKIATKSGDSRFSSTKDKVRVYRLRATVDAILVGKNTVKRDDPILTVHQVKGKNPIRIILDSSATINTKSRIIKTCNKIPTIIAVSKKASNKNLEKLQKFPLRIIVSGNNIVNIKKLLKTLWKLKIKKILVEGGGTVNWEFVNQNLFDEIIITITPFLVGGKDAVSIIEGKGFTKITKSRKLKLEKILHLDNQVVLHYKKSK
ncbi:MAG TPA: 2,5-diamino-6-(ribosylamino)-4(3H)-pyrimidinone 5'-phosphate reductase [Nitrosopumilaceae archaeon]|nr:2,5-diamino-6-(ribosylamino)-4(3H)-pyrimidinone 5'-phosphate reductase [Nitrosopumilaceae archaeon]